MERKTEPRTVFHDNYISYSRIKTFKTCPRRFEFVYLMGLEDKAGRAAQIGSVVHKILELYVNDVRKHCMDHGEATAQSLCGYMRQAIDLCGPSCRITTKDIAEHLEAFRFLNDDMDAVSRTEKRTDDVIQGYRFVSIVDRIDEQEGTKTLIDYKTGKRQYVRNMQLQMYAYTLHGGEFRECNLEYQFFKSFDKREWKYTKKKHNDVYDWIFSHVNEIEQTTDFRCIRTPLCGYCSFQSICC